MSNGPLCLSSIFSIVPVLNSIPSVVLFDIDITHVFVKASVIFPSQR